MESSNANIVVVDDELQMEKILEVKQMLPKLKAVVQISEPFDKNLKNKDGIWSWTELETMNTDDAEGEYEKRHLEIAANQCCAVLYTSGTVGDPKGAMISHDNFTWTARSLANRLGVSVESREVFMSYLPLSHMAGQIMDVFLSLSIAATVYFAEKDAIKSSFLETLSEVRPTLFIGVPRIYEKIQFKVLKLESEAGILRKFVDEAAKRISLHHHLKKIPGKLVNSLAFEIAKVLSLNQKKVAIGLDRCRNLITAAAPMQIELKLFFLSLDLPLRNKCGMTEVTVHCVASFATVASETVGKNIDGVETKILNPDVNSEGEICVRGRNVFMGYINDECKTRETIDDGRWLHTGDFGRIDDEGFVYITGRLKEIIITSGGENVAPVRIEDHIKAECPAISNAFLVGDRRKFLNILLTFKTEVDVNGVPTDDLSSETLKWLESLNMNCSKLHEVLAEPKVHQAIQETIDKVNKNSISNAQKVQKFSLLPRDFSFTTGEIGPTLKLKRNVVMAKYKKEIDEFYE